LLEISRFLVPLAVLLLFLQRAQGNLYWTAFYTVSLLLLLLSCAVLVGRLPLPPRLTQRVALFEMAFVIFLHVVALYQGGSTVMQVLFCPAIISIFLLFPPERWRALTIFLAAGWLLPQVPILFTTKGFLVPTAINGMTLFTSWSIGLLVRRFMDQQKRSDQLLAEVTASQAALARAHRQLQETAAQAQQMAVLEERQRIAREIHDSVAHGLTVLIVQLQAARRMLPGRPEDALAWVARAEESARGALQEARQAVRALHPSGLDATSDGEALRRLGRDFGAATGIDVTVTEGPGVADLAPQPHRIEQLYRIMQEALTNAHRHGGARQVWAELRLERDSGASPTGAQLRLLIQNDGKLPTAIETGVGLKSMSERARSLGGSASVSVVDGRFTIQVTIPVEEVTTRDPALALR
jgi:signal transduction histidine kinase